RLADRRLLGGVGPARVLERALDEQHRAAVHPPHLTARRERGEIATDGDLGDAEHLAQLVHAQELAGAQGGQHAASPCGRGHRSRNYTFSCSVPTAYEFVSGSERPGGLSMRVRFACLVVLLAVSAPAARAQAATHTVTFDGYSFMVDGQRTYLWS